MTNELGGLEPSLGCAQKQNCILLIMKSGLTLIFQKKVWFVCFTEKEKIGASVFEDFIYYFICSIRMISNLEIDPEIWLSHENKRVGIYS